MTTSAPAHITVPAPDALKSQLAAHRWIRILHVHLLRFHRVTARGAAALRAFAHGLQHGAGRVGHQHPIHRHTRQPSLGGPHLRSHGRQNLRALGNGLLHGQRRAPGRRAALLSDVHWLSFTVLIASRLVLGVGESLGSTGATLWGITAAGQEHTAKVIGMNGISTYGGMALAAPLGVVLDQ